MLINMHEFNSWKKVSNSCYCASPPSDCGAGYDAGSCLPDTVSQVCGRSGSKVTWENPGLHNKYIGTERDSKFASQRFLEHWRYALYTLLCLLSSLGVQIG